jgi:hypothetical protein
MSLPGLIQKKLGTSNAVGNRFEKLLRRFNDVSLDVTVEVAGFENPQCILGEI